MAENKKVNRRKSYKTMSVSELVAARKELINSIEQIDVILQGAVEALSNKVNINYSNSLNETPNYFIGGPTNDPFKERFNNPNPSVNNIPSVVNKPSFNADNQSSGFSLFDTDSYLQSQMSAEQQNKTVESAEFDYDENSISKEIEELKTNFIEGVNELKNVQDTSTTTE